MAFQRQMGKKTANRVRAAHLGLPCTREHHRKSAATSCMAHAGRAPTNARPHICAGIGLIPRASTWDAGAQSGAAASDDDDTDEDEDVDERDEGEPGRKPAQTSGGDDSGGSGGGGSGGGEAEEAEAEPQPHTSQSADSLGHIGGGSSQQSS